MHASLLGCLLLWELDELIHVNFLEPCLSSSKCSMNISHYFVLLLSLLFNIFDTRKRPYFKKKVDSKETNAST